MTIQERINHGLIYNTYKNGWREGTVKELINDYPFLEEYINNINWWHDNNRVAILKSINNERYYQLYLFSEKHKYSIRVEPEYIGCISSSLYKLPFEDWNRGYDMPDGKATEETFKDIVFAILHDELVPYDDGRKPPISESEK